MPWYVTIFLIPIVSTINVSSLQSYSDGSAMSLLRFFRECRNSIAVISSHDVHPKSASHVPLLGVRVPGCARQRTSLDCSRTRVTSLAPNIKQL